MKLHLFEFIDAPWVPQSIRQTMLEYVECCNTRVRPYNQQVCDEVLQHVNQHQLTTIVELGAGTAPITRLLAGDERSSTLRLIACDLEPHAATIDEFRDDMPDRVSYLPTSIDFTQRHSWEEGTALVICCAMHHVPWWNRGEAIENLTRSANCVMIFEPVRKTLVSMLLVLPAVFVPWLMSILYFNRPGKLRRLVWCWLVPVMPFVAFWDAMVGCLRQWNDHEWHEVFEQLEGTRIPVIRSQVHSQVVIW